MIEKSPFVEIAKKACPAVITIVISKDLPKVEGYYLMPFGGQDFVLPNMKKGKEKTKIGGGSGFIVSADGYVLTCNHVVGDPEADYTVIIDPGHKYPAKILANDPLIDVAVLKIQNKNFTYLELGDSDKIELGEQVLAIGNPLGEFEDTLSAGIISGLSRRITAQGGHQGKITSLRGLIQTDAAINPGNSGGPLVDMAGKVIGINTAVIAGAQNIGFAIPVNYAQKTLEEVKKYGKIRRPFLGVRYIILNPDISKMNKLPVDYGALIVRENFGEPAVLKNSAADKAGLKEYDIVLEADGKKIVEENPLSDILKDKEIGGEITLKVLREKKETDLKVKLEEKK
ncbi:MAG: trypsin-like peptidase domain-containing protein [Candidatus Taylorbacteria bacterium]|nr:trypsin-like peptidase domain-containing protein [Candidatus Taylorbacteria bacterium]